MAKQETLPKGLGVAKFDFAKTLSNQIFSRDIKSRLKITMINFHQSGKTDPSEIERTYNIRKQQSLFMRTNGKCNNSHAPLA